MDDIMHPILVFDFFQKYIDAVYATGLIIRYQKSLHGEKTTINRFRSRKKNLIKSRLCQFFFLILNNVSTCIRSCNCYLSTPVRVSRLTDEENIFLPFFLWGPWCVQSFISRVVLSWQFFIFLFCWPLCFPSVFKLSVLCLHAFSDRRYPFTTFSH